MCAVRTLIHTNDMISVRATQHGSIHRTAAFVVCSAGLVLGVGEASGQGPGSQDDRIGVLAAAVEYARGNVRNHLLQGQKRHSLFDDTPTPRVVLVPRRSSTLDFGAHGLFVGLSNPNNVAAVASQLGVEMRRPEEGIFLNEELRISLSEPQIHGDTAEVAVSFDSVYAGVPALVSALIRFVRNRHQDWRPATTLHCIHSTGSGGCSLPEIDGSPG